MFRRLRSVFNRGNAGATIFHKQANYLRFTEIVNQRQPETELEMIHKCVTRGSSFGDNLWVRKIALRFGLRSTLNPRGRPSNKAEK